jgi:hypothetical protein
VSFKEEKRLTASSARIQGLPIHLRRSGGATRGVESSTKHCREDAQKSQEGISFSVNLAFFGGYWFDGCPHGLWRVRKPNPVKASQSESNLQAGQLGLPWACVWAPWRLALESEAKRSRESRPVTLSHGDLEKGFRSKNAKLSAKT